MIGRVGAPATFAPTALENVLSERADGPLHDSGVIIARALAGAASREWEE